VQPLPDASVVCGRKEEGGNTLTARSAALSAPRHGLLGPTNCAQWKQAVAAVLQAVNDRQITVRNVRE
jgi:hypothetical protein